jgi:hypothetical protein
LKIGCVVQVFESSPKNLINSAVPQQRAAEEQALDKDYFENMTDILQTRIIKKQGLNNSS